MGAGERASLRAAGEESGSGAGVIAAVKLGVEDVLEGEGVDLAQLARTRLAAAERQFKGAQPARRGHTHIAELVLIFPQKATNQPRRKTQAPPATL